MATSLLSFFSAGLRALSNMVFGAQAPESPSSEKEPLINDFDSCLALVHNESSHQTFTLPDNRKLGFATFGSETGPTVFYLHGFGDSRLTGAWFDSAAKEQGIRLVAVDRPGIGLSDPKPNRRLLDYAEDIRLLAVHTKAQTYSVLAVSGGGPYALACAYALPAEQLKAVSIVCGMGPFDLTMRHSAWTTYIIFNAMKFFPRLLRWSRARTFKDLQTKTAETFIAETKAQLSAWYLRFLGPGGPDAALLQNDEFLAFVYEAGKEGLRQGVDGAVEEWAVMTSNDVGFRLEDLRDDLPVDLWYGRQDASMSWRVGEALAEAVGGMARLFVREEGHLSLVMNWRGEVLERMVERM